MDGGVALPVDAREPVRLHHTSRPSGTIAIAQLHYIGHCATLHALRERVHQRSRETTVAAATGARRDVSRHRVGNVPGHVTYTDDPRSRPLHGRTRSEIRAGQPDSRPLPNANPALRTRPSRGMRISRFMVLPWSTTTAPIGDLRPLLAAIRLERARPRQQRPIDTTASAALIQSHRFRRFLASA